MSIVAVVAACGGDAPKDGRTAEDEVVPSRLPPLPQASPAQAEAPPAQEEAAQATSEQTKGESPRPSTAPDAFPGTVYISSSPLAAREYIVSKALTLSAFALVEAAIVVLVAGRAELESPILLVLGVLVLGACYTLVGVGQVAPYRSVTSFLFPGAVVVSLVLLRFGG